MEEFVKDDPDRPDVDRISVCMEFSLFGSDVLFGAGDRLHDYAFGA